jgi:DNA-binding transcriptional ArsR family regulator
MYIFSKDVYDLWMYDEFRRVNRSFQERMEAILSGILSPDLKGITLQAMRRGVAYTISSLYKEVCDFIGVDKLPIKMSSLWIYCYGDPSRGVWNTLETVGVVERGVKPTDTPTGSIYAVAYEKNDAGFDLGDPSVALGTYIVNKLYRERKTKYFSLGRILGKPPKPRWAGCRESYVVYRLVDFLARNQKDKFRFIDIREELSGLGSTTISGALNKLGEMGIIDYRSPIRDLEGRRAKNWVRHKLTVNRIDYEEVREKAKEMSRRFTSWGCLRKVIDYINQNPREEFTHRGLADKLGISEDTSSKCLWLLNSIGYLSSEFRGSEVQSIAKANENTILLYEEFFEPIARMCRRLDPDAQGFRDKLEYYLDHRDLWREHLKTQVYVYDRERIHVGLVGGEVRRLILKVLESGEVKKLSHICDDVSKISPRKLTRDNIRNHLKILMRDGLVERVRDGWYRKVS